VGELQLSAELVLEKEESGMTREEVIEEVKNYDNYPNGISKECRYYIVRVLEQEPCEDAISREEAFEALNSLNGTAELDMAFEAIEKLPPVTPIRKKGEWCKQNDDYFDWYECSECGYGSEGEMQYSSEYEVRTKYCPNCGAEMESEE
jgi:hypothetical protein